MKRYDLVVIGAGPAGLSAAIEAANAGMHTVVFDENAKPGGQLFKQIHKFFGSKENKARIRGFRIGQELLESARESGVEVVLNAVVLGLYREKEVTVRVGGEILHYKGDYVLAATGATENVVRFPGWTLPGVIGAGAAQTLMNLHKIKPGKRILMLGSGNVGLVVSYQLLQAGCEVVALVDAAPQIGGYGVHASKLSRCGVPFYLSHTIVRAEGEDCVTGVTIGEVGPDWEIKEGSEKYFNVDTICLAVGLTPMSQLLAQAGCEMTETKDGYISVCDEFGKTSIPGIYAAGDVSGIEEASSAMLGGQISGVSIAYEAGFLEEKDEKITSLRASLSNLRKGMFAPENRGMQITKTEEGIDISSNLLSHGFVKDEEIERFPGVVHMAGVHPVIECTQNIPCNPCQDVCPKNCISIGDNITSLPVVNQSSTCIGCGMCVASCSGQAIFLLNEDIGDDMATVAIPYEFLPLPEVGDKGTALGRDGQKVCETEVCSIKKAAAFDATNVLTMKVPKNYAAKARFFVPAAK